MPRYSPKTGLLSTYQVGPYDSTHLYLQWGGKLRIGETWSCGLRLRSPQATVGIEATEMIDAVGAAVSAYHSRQETGISGQAQLSFVKLNPIALTGQYYADRATTEKVYPDVPGGAGPSQQANQVALVVSLTTGFSRGPAHAGRFYLPLPATTVGSDGKISEVFADGVKTSTDTFIAALNAAAGNHQVVIMSRKAGAAGHRAVTGCKVGMVLDTQRRRRRSLAENYQ